MPTRADPRAAAWEILLAVRRKRHFDDALGEALGPLEPADRRLAHEIAAGVLRGRTELDRRLRPLVSGQWRRITPDLKDVLRIGAYQLTELTRVPPYAAVETAVALAKTQRGTRGAALVNAVLRRLAAQRADQEEAGDLAARHSHPPWLVARWRRRFGDDATARLLRHNNRRPALVLQPARWSVEALEAALEEARVPHAPASLGRGFAVETRSVTTLPGFADGGFVVQDAAQAVLLEQVDIPDGALVWDACAAPGGKAVILSQRCRVIASEYRRTRLTRLRAAAERAGADLDVLCADARVPPLAPGAVDVLVVDAPCSATGTMARHPDARWRLSPERLRDLGALQGAILDGACSAVRPGGALAYLTCSLEPEENEGQIARFLEAHPEFERDRDDAFVFPPDAGTDGGYAARLRRAA